MTIRMHRVTLILPALFIFAVAIHMIAGFNKRVEYRSTHQDMPEPSAFPVIAALLLIVVAGVLCWTALSSSVEVTSGTVKERHEYAVPRRYILVIVDTNGNCAQIPFSYEEKTEYEQYAVGDNFPGKSAKETTGTME